MFEIEKYYDPKTDSRPSAPFDVLTGVPLPIAPHKYPKSEIEQKNPHHAIYPKNHPILLGTLGGQALRVARLQIVPVLYHNQDSETAFHNVYGNGISIPESVNEQMGLCTLLVSGYIPDFVVDTSAGKASVRKIQDWERKTLQANVPIGPVSNSHVKCFRDKVLPDTSLKEAKLELLKLKSKTASTTYQHLHLGTNQIRDFYKDYIFSQDPSALNRRLMGRFLLTGQPESGMKLLGHAASLAAKVARVNGASLEGVFLKLLKEGKMNPKMGNSLATFMLERTGTKYGREKIVDEFRIHLEKVVA